MNQHAAVSHVTWHAERDPFGRFFLFFFCAVCGDRSQKRCNHPERAPHWANVYAYLHQHATAAPDGRPLSRPP